MSLRTGKRWGLFLLLEGLFWRNGRFQLVAAAVLNDTTRRHVTWPSQAYRKSHSCKSLIQSGICFDDRKILWQCLRLLLSCWDKGRFTYGNSKDEWTESLLSTSHNGHIQTRTFEPLGRQSISHRTTAVPIFCSYEFSTKFFFNLQLPHCGRLDFGSN